MLSLIHCSSMHVAVAKVQLGLEQNRGFMLNITISKMDITGGKKTNLYLIDLTCSSGLDQLYILTILNKTKASRSSACSFSSAFSLDLVSSINICRCFCHARACKDNISVCFRWRHKMDDGSPCWSGAGGLAALPWGVRGWETCMGDGRQFVMPNLDVILNQKSKWSAVPTRIVYWYCGQHNYGTGSQTWCWSLGADFRPLFKILLMKTHPAQIYSLPEVKWVWFEQKKCRARGTPINRVWNLGVKGMAHQMLKYLRLTVLMAISWWGTEFLSLLRKVRSSKPHWHDGMNFGITSWHTVLGYGWDLASDPRDPRKTL